MKAQRGLYSFFNLGAGWGWVVNAMSQLLYSQESSTGGRQVRNEHVGFVE
jgi:hypothetical protein